MTSIRVYRSAISCMTLAALLLESAAAGAEARIYADVSGTTVLDNSRVVVQKFTIQPGQSTGFHNRAGNQLLVFVKGGVLTSKATGRSAVWPDGRVVWQDDERGDDGSTNTGSAPIELIWATIKPAQLGAAAAGRKPRYGYLNYPNVPGEDVLENDRVIVQRFKLKPGQWEGVHAHNPNTFYIFIKGGQWLSKSKDHPEGVAGSATDGAVAWMDAIDLADQHESGNRGTTTAEVVWVALKQ